MSNKWKTDINDFSIIDDKKAKFLLNEFKEVLKNTIDFSNQIDNKSLILISVYISLLTLIIGLQYNNIHLFLFIIISLIISLFCVLKNVSPAKFKGIGNEPKNLYIKDVCEHSYIGIILSECDHYQGRIDENKKVNDNKCKNLKYSINIFFYLLIINIIFLFGFKFSSKIFSLI